MQAEFAYLALFRVYLRTIPHLSREPLHLLTSHFAGAFGNLVASSGCRHHPPRAPPYAVWRPLRRSGPPAAGACRVAASLAARCRRLPHGRISGTSVSGGMNSLTRVGLWAIVLVVLTSSSLLAGVLAIETNEVQLVPACDPTVLPAAPLAANAAPAAARYPPRRRRVPVRCVPLPYALRRPPPVPLATCLAAGVCLPDCATPRLSLSLQARQRGSSAHCAPTPTARLAFCRLWPQ